MAHLHGVSPEDVVVLEYDDSVNAVKVTLKRRVPSGNPGDADRYCMNQEGPTLHVRIPRAFFQGLI